LLQRTTARVIAALLFAERPTITTGELGDRLRDNAWGFSTPTGTT